MNVLKAILIVIGIPSVFGGLLFLGGSFTGAGHGTTYFADIILAPFSTNEPMAVWRVMLWPAEAVLLVFRRYTSCRLTAGVILTTHYLGVVLLSINTEWHYVGKTWKVMPAFVLLFLVLYISMQALMWLLIIRQHLASRKQA